MSNDHILLIEPFYSGSHKVLMDLINEALTAQENVKVHFCHLPGKKWHWRARTSALYFSENIPKDQHFTCIFSSSVLPLHELLGLRPDLQKAKKIIYFHENQLVYPVRKSKDRDFQYGYNQIMSCLAADKVIFNSQFNKDSFLSTLKPFFKLQPDHRPKELSEKIEPKCQVLYFPMSFENITELCKGIKRKNNGTTKTIVWPHRWEFDKNPELFFRVIFKLVETGTVNFKLNVLGERFLDNPSIFAESENKLKDFISNFGYLPSKEDYFKVLAESDIVVSTADHEFFGVAMMEATFLGCIPVCPKKIVYPEIYKDEKLLFSTENQLFEILRDLLKLDNCNNYYTFDSKPYDWKYLKEDYLNLLLTYPK